MATVLEGAASWVDRLTYEQIPEEARHNARRAALDLLGVAVAASKHEIATKLKRYLGISALINGESATLIGQTEHASIEGATMFNSAIGHALDFDDSSDTLGGHPTVMILPALLALGEARQLSGKQITTAYSAGVEVAAHLASQVNIAHYERGWHPTTTLGLFGTAAATAKLMGLDVIDIANALSIVAAFPSGTRSSFGTHMKSVQVGEAARRGLTAALLASVGIRGNPSAFEDPQGFGVVYNGEDGFGQEPFDASPTRSWELIDPGLTIKQYPCCASAHPAVDAVLNLREGLGNGDLVESVRIRLHPRRLRHTNNPAPTTPLQAKFSVQYVVAVALSSGSVTLKDFERSAIDRPEVRDLLARTHAEPFSPEENGPDHYAGEVELHLADGSRRRRRVDRARGRGTKVALTNDEVDRKFRSCVEPVLGPEVTESVGTAIMSLDSVTDIGTVMRMLTVMPQGR